MKTKETNFVGKKREIFIAAVRKREMLEASKVKMSGSEKIKANMNTGNKIFGKHIPKKIFCN